MAQTTTNRWLVAIMGTLLQVTLGSIYAWSYFQKPLMAHTGWSNQQVAWILSLAICFLGLTAAVGGTLLPRFGPRKLAMTGILFYSAGWILGGFALELKSLPLLYAGLGVIGGIGLGLGYVTPVATAAKWFPDRKGFITGMVVMGFGLGALFVSKLVGPYFIGICTTISPEGAIVIAWPKAFYLIAVSLGIPGIISSCYMINPPEGFTPVGWDAPASENEKTAGPGQHLNNVSFQVVLYLCFQFFSVTLRQASCLSASSRHYSRICCVLITLP